MVSWAESLRRWSDFLSVTGFSQKTILQYRGALIRFMARTLLELNEATEDDLVAYITSLEPKGSARGEAMRAFRSYYRWAEVRIRPDNPAFKFKIPRPKLGPAPEISDWDLARFIYTAALYRPRWAWAFIFAFGTGGRRESLCCVEPRDVDLEKATVHFRVVKNDRPYTVELGSAGLEAVRELLKYGHPRLIGISPGRLWQWFRIISLRADLHVWPHLFRHGFATRLAMVADNKTLMELMGWADLTQFPRYVASNEDKHRDAMARAGL